MFLRFLVFVGFQKENFWWRIPAHVSGPTLWQRPAGVQINKGVGAPRQDWSEGMFSYGKSSVLRFCKGSTFVKTRGMLLVGKPCS